MPIHTHRRKFALTLALLVTFILSACYRATPIEGVLMDEQSGLPLADAVVVANWQALGAKESLREDGQLATIETRTDARGHYSFPGMGAHIKWFGKVTSVNTRLFFFKSGYQGLVITSNATNATGAVPLMSLAGQSRNDKLRAAEPSPRPRIESFDLFNNALRRIMDNVEACPWRQIPDMLREVHKERLALLPHALDSDAWPLITIDDDLIMNAAALEKRAGKACGSPKEVFQLQSPSR